MLSQHEVTQNEYSTCLKHLDCVENTLEKSELFREFFNVVEQIKNNPPEMP